MPKRTSKGDINQTAYSVVQRVTGGSPSETKAEKNPAAVALGRLGGLKGGMARAKKLDSYAENKDPLQRLLRDYPSHDSVIDPVEAKELFETVSDPKETLAKFGMMLKSVADSFLTSDEAFVMFFDENTGGSNASNNHSTATTSGASDDKSTSPTGVETPEQPTTAGAV
jgi:hypothetical protein